MRDYAIFICIIIIMYYGTKVKAVCVLVFNREKSLKCFVIP